MDTSALKKFAQAARRQLMDQVSGKLSVVMQEGSAARREKPVAIAELQKQIDNKGREQVVEEVAYTWFNRFTALRFMDVNDYTTVRAVSPSEGATRPELLAEAMAGNLPEGAPEAVQALLSGRAPSTDPQGEAYRLLLVHTCNAWHDTMPYMFEKIDDYSEVLMPDDLLSQWIFSGVVAGGDDGGSLSGCRDHRLALPVLHFRKERRGLCGPEEEQEDHRRKHPCSDAAVHAALDRPLSGRKFAGAALAAQSAQQSVG